MTLQTRIVLRAFLRARLDDTSGELFGAQICRETDLGPGTVHMIVTRLLEAGWLTDRWEDDDGMLDRPRRRYLRLNDGGAAQAREAVAHADARRRDEPHPVPDTLADQA